MVSAGVWDCSNACILSLSATVLPLAPRHLHHRCYWFSRALCSAGAINVVEWTTFSKCQTATLTQHQTRAVTYYHEVEKSLWFIFAVCFITNSHANSAVVSIVKPGWLLTVVHMKQSLLVLMLNTFTGGDWSSSPTVPKFPDVHLNVNCAVNCPLAVFLVYLTATDTCLYWSRLLPTARQVKWWLSSVVTVVLPSPPTIYMSREGKLVLITPPSGSEHSCDAAGEQ